MSSIKKKFIGDAQVGATKVRLENNATLKARNAADSADVDLFKLSSADVFTLSRDVSGGGSFKMIDLPAPSGNDDAATKGYVDGLVDDYILLSEKGANNGVATLGAGGKIPASQLPSSVMEYQGNWDADTNTPTLADGTGDAGDVYRVSVAGSQDLGSGSEDYVVGDWVVYNGSIWQKSSNGDAVTSVNGQSGIVVLDTDDISEGSALYFTDARAIAAPLTGYTSGAGTVAATDSILEAIQKLNGNIAALPSGATNNKEKLTLNGTDVTNQYKDLEQVVKANSLLLVVGGVPQAEGDDYTLNLTGGAGGKTRVTFVNDLATGGPSALISGDILYVQYQY